MAGHGPPPKSDDQRRRRNKRPPTVKLDAAPVVAPELPGADEYLPQTVSWYSTWASSPQASRFTPTDWQRLHMLAPLVNRFWEAPTKELMAELRLNESLLGATEADRLRLHWTVEREEASSAPAPRPTGRRAALRVVDAAG